MPLDRNPGSGYDTPRLRLIPGDILSACPHNQFHTLLIRGLLDSRAALANSYPNAFVPRRWRGSLYHFYDDLWYDPVGARTRYLPYEVDTLPLSLPDAVQNCINTRNHCRSPKSYMGDMSQQLLGFLAKYNFVFLLLSNRMSDLTKSVFGVKYLTLKNSLNFF